MMTIMMMNVPTSRVYEHELRKVTFIQQMSDSTTSGVEHYRPLCLPRDILTLWHHVTLYHMIWHYSVWHYSVTLSLSVMWQCHIIRYIMRHCENASPPVFYPEFRIWECRQEVGGAFPSGPPFRLPFVIPFSTSPSPATGRLRSAVSFPSRPGWPTHFDAVWGKKNTFRGLNFVQFF